MSEPKAPVVVVIGGGPAGLMAAETARAAGAPVHLYDRMGSVGRKFLIAGKGGLNLTHSDPFETFVSRYRHRAPELRTWLEKFDADALRAWARGLGVETFVGTSGRVFPTDLKAAPLLRGWVRRLRADGVVFHMHERWLGWDEEGSLRFERDGVSRCVRAGAIVLALGGGSWSVLGSDGAWVSILERDETGVAPLRPSNCGFDVAVAGRDGWSEHFAARHAGDPVKPVVVEWGRPGSCERRQGEFVVTQTGVEGSLVYAASADLRDAIARDGRTTIRLDLAPARTRERLERDLAQPRGKRTLSEHLRRHAGIDGVKSGLLYELVDKATLADAGKLAAAIKALPLELVRARPLDEAISTAGGVEFTALDGSLMLRKRPGTFCAGEMVDWEAPTGGYLLTACFASGHITGEAAARFAMRGAGQS